MKVSIYSLKKILFEGDASSVNCKTKNGEITVLDHHRPLISELTKGVMKITDPAHKEHFIPVGGGFLEVQKNNRVSLLVDEA